MSIFDIADEIVTLLNVVVDEEEPEDVYPFTYPFTAAVQLLPKFKKSELENWNVTVFPVSEVPTNDTRNSYYADCTIPDRLDEADKQRNVKYGCSGFMVSLRNQGYAVYMFNKNLSNGKFIKHQKRSDLLD